MTKITISDRDSSVTTELLSEDTDVYEIIDAFVGMLITQTYHIDSIKRALQHTLRKLDYAKNEEEI